MEKVILGLMLGLFFSAPSFAENFELSKQYNLNLATAEKLAINAEKSCQQLNKHLAVAIFRGGPTCLNN